MKDHSWLAVFSIFTLIVGFLFTYGNGASAGTSHQPVAVSFFSTSTPAVPTIIKEATQALPQPITVVVPPAAAPIITVNVTIATSSQSQVDHTPSTPPAPNQTSSSYTYYVTNNYPTQDNTTASSSPAATTTAETPKTVSLRIAGIYDTATTTSITQDETVLELLQYLDSVDPNLKLQTHDYGDLGVLVTSMGGYTNGTDSKYWQYAVDGTSPDVGADKYHLVSGDTVEWDYKGY